LCRHNRLWDICRGCIAHRNDIQSGLDGRFGGHRALCAVPHPLYCGTGERVGVAWELAFRSRDTVAAHGACSLANVELVRHACDWMSVPVLPECGWLEWPYPH